MDPLPPSIYGSSKNRGRAGHALGKGTARFVHGTTQMKLINLKINKLEFYFKICAKQVYWGSSLFFLDLQNATMHTLLAVWYSLSILAGHLSSVNHQGLSFQTFQIFRIWICCSGCFIFSLPCTMAVATKLEVPVLTGHHLPCFSPLRRHLVVAADGNGTNIA